MKKTRRKKKIESKKMFLLAVVTLLMALLAIFLGLKVTENGTFYVMDLNHPEETLATYHHFTFARNKMNRLEGSDVYIVDENGRIVAVKEGLVNFHTKDASQHTSYRIDANDSNGYTNGSYGADALYLGTDDSGTQVKFLLSGVTGWVDIAEVELYMFDEDIMVSSYHIQDGSLIHTICTDMVQGSSASYPIGPAPKGLEENVIYYSYDGHWFYADLKQMADDKRNDSTDNAVNQEAYYNFYQYMPHRSYSSITAQDINDFLESRGIDASADTYPCEANQSVLYDQGDLFVGTQKAYGVNAAMIAALALNESSYGQSQYAIENNNLFGHAVYDESPDSANTYVSLEQCIINHAQHFIQEDYANPDSAKYNGSWFGDKNSGINVNYASDPYWAEKAAFFYYQLDPDAYKSYTLITQEAKKEIPVYNKVNGDVLYSYDQSDIVSFLVIDEKDGWIEVQSEIPIINNKGNIEEIYTKDSTVYVKRADLD